MAQGKFVRDGREYNATPKIRQLQRKTGIAQKRKDRLWELYKKSCRELEALSKKLDEEEGRVSRRDFHQTMQAAIRH